MDKSELREILGKMSKEEIREIFNNKEISEAVKAFHSELERHIRFFSDLDGADEFVVLQSLCMDLGLRFEYVDGRIILSEQGGLSVVTPVQDGDQIEYRIAQDNRWTAEKYLDGNMIDTAFDIVLNVRNAMLDGKLKLDKDNELFGLIPVNTDGDEDIMMFVRPGFGKTRIKRTAAIIDVLYYEMIESPYFRNHDFGIPRTERTIIPVRHPISDFL